MSTDSATRDTRTARTAPVPVDQPEEASIGRLVADASRDLSTLVQNEIALAKAEVKVTVRNGGLAAAMFAAAGFVAVLAIIMLSVAIAYFIHMTGLDLAFCFLIVFVLYLAIAGVLGLVGIKKIKQVGPPERAIAQAQETKKVLSNRG